MRLTGAPSREDAKRKRVLRWIAAVLAVVGIVLIIVRPAPRYRAEARIIVAAPLTANGLVDAIGPQGSGASDIEVRADDGLVLISSTGSSRNETRDRVVGVARSALDANLRQVQADADRQATAARAEGNDAAVELEALINRTGVENATSELAKVEAEFDTLVDQHRQAVAAGQPVAEIDAALAETQEDLFELRSQVTLRDDLQEQQATANAQEAEATERRIDAGFATRSAAVVGTVDEVGRWPAVSLALIAFGLAGGALLAAYFVDHPVPGAARLRRRRVETARPAPPEPSSRPFPSSPPSMALEVPEPIVAPADAAKSEETSTLNSVPRSTDSAVKNRAYLRSVTAREQAFYRALSPPSAEDEGDADGESAFEVDEIGAIEVDDVDDASIDLTSQAMRMPPGSPDSSLAPGRTHHHM